VRLAAVAIAAGCLTGALLAAPPSSAYADVRANGGGQQLLPPSGLAPSDPAEPPSSAQAAIAALALAQLGRSDDGPNTLDGGAFGSSSALPGAWCAAFAG